VAEGPDTENPVELEPQMMLFGLAQAIARFTRSGDSRDVLAKSDKGPEADRRVFTAEWSTALFEALNWSVSLNDRLKRDLGADDWTVGLENAGVVRGMRYARNSVHHDWAAALNFGSQPQENVAQHGIVFDLTWATHLPSGRPDRKGATAYAECLAGEKVADTLLRAVKVFEEGAQRLRIAQASPRIGPMSKPMALYHCVYADEDFEDAAHKLFEMVAYAARTFPDAGRALFLDIEGHRTQTGAFDQDMFELQREFLLGFLMPYLNEVHTPLVHARNPKPQLDDVPEEFFIHNVP
jgi:hypothetical protein